MTDLIDEVKASFSRTREDADGDGGVQLVRPVDMEEFPAFNEMREFYSHKLLMWARRGYRHFAGSTMTHDADQLLLATGEVMMPPMVATGLAAFSNGVLIGHQDNYLVQMHIHFGTVEQLFQEQEFREASTKMAGGFSEDPEVQEFFTDYILGGLAHLAHLTGFAHSEVDPGTVWDLWLLCGTSIVATGYLAGLQMGQTWRERDVLDGIAIATEEGADGPAGEADPGLHADEEDQG